MWHPSISYSPFHFITCALHCTCYIHSMCLTSRDMTAQYSRRYCDALRYITSTLTIRVRSMRITNVYTCLCRIGYLLGQKTFNNCVVFTCPYSTRKANHTHTHESMYWYIHALRQQRMCTSHITFMLCALMLCWSVSIIPKPSWLILNWQSSSCSMVHMDLLHMQSISYILSCLSVSKGKHVAQECVSFCRVAYFLKAASMASSSGSSSS